ncbi:hypothetical protein B0T17DRAFT_542850 [Bombardia bombarda]|uniref:Uncharacterized protein n=1 Tax=Bombardia bombarda TaxID=252184 RepID=A0AA39U812_9PEZI|nr:hypothetical protein B0T17DRAFT_542850 [Bombardia bombarda]
MGVDLACPNTSFFMVNRPLLFISFAYYSLIVFVVVSLRVRCYNYHIMCCLHHLLSVLHFVVFSVFQLDLGEGRVYVITGCTYYAHWVIVVLIGTVWMDVVLYVCRLIG